MASNAPSSTGGASSSSSSASKKSFAEKTKERDVRTSNITAAKAVADAVRTSLGPKGLDKMIEDPNTGDVMITNDGATLLKKMEMMHPTAKMLVDLAQAQDVEAGDGTTTVTVIAGSLLGECQGLLEMGIHPTTITDCFIEARQFAEDVLKKMAQPIDLANRDQLLNSAKTSLSSKVVSQNSALLARYAVDAVLHVIDPKTATNVDLKDINVVKNLGGTVDSTELVHGLVFAKGASHAGRGPTRITNAKIGLIQFQLSSPKTNMENQIVIDDYQKMDRVIKEDQKYIVDMCKRIKRTGCNVLLIQKSILRDAVNDTSLQVLARMKIMVVTDVERSDIEFISKTVGAIPIASIEAFAKGKLGTAELVEEVSTSGGKIVKVTGVPAGSKTVSVLVRGSNRLVLDEAERSFHDALCVVRSLVKNKSLIAGGGAAEMQLALAMEKHAKKLNGVAPYVFKAFSRALEVIPYTLAENAGLNPIVIVTQLRNKHITEGPNFGIDVRKGAISNMFEQNVVQPLLVSLSAIRLAVDTVNQILKIDDFVPCR